MSEPTLIEREYYEKLVGRTIIGLQWEVIEGDALPVLVLSGRDKDGNAPSVAVLSDPEGNGVGFLEHTL